MVGQLGGEGKSDCGVEGLKRLGGFGGFFGTGILSERWRSRSEWVEKSSVYLRVGGSGKC